MFLVFLYNFSTTKKNQNLLVYQKLNLVFTLNIGRRMRYHQDLEELTGMTPVLSNTRTFICEQCRLSSLKSSVQLRQMQTFVLNSVMAVLVGLSHELSVHLIVEELLNVK